MLTIRALARELCRALIHVCLIILLMIASRLCRSMVKGFSVCDKMTS